MVQLYDSIKASYKPVDRLGKHGQYVKDKSLSNDNEQVYYNKKKNKLLYSVAGTHNIKDAVTDGYLAFGRLKDTSRYKEAASVLDQAKAKYKPKKTIGVGHSLGGSIVGYLPVDRSTTLDKGATVGQPIGSTEKAYRSKGDAVSLLNAGYTAMHTLDNPNKAYRTGHPFLDIVGNALNAHNVDNIKQSNLFA
jgi:hypothetical protein